MTTDVIDRHPTVGQATPAARGWRAALIGLVALEVLVLFAPTMVFLWERWTMSVWQNAHGMFVPLLAGWLAWQGLRRSSHVPAAASSWGFAFLLPALLLHALDAGIHTQLLSAFALFLALPGFALLLLGSAKTRLIAFPLAFLAFALPIPLGFTEPLHLLLREIAATATAAVLPLVGVSVFREGTTLHTTAGLVGISDACSGFSTLYASVTFAALLSYLASSWRARILVLTAAPVVAITANLLRVIVLTLMVAWGHAWLLDTFVHPLSGMLTFALALPVLLWLSERKGQVPQP